MLHYFTKSYPYTAPTPNLPFYFLKCCNTLSDVHSTEIETFGDQNDLLSTCISSVNCTQNWELPVALSVTSETFGDVKMKHEERVHNGVISS